MQFTDLPKAVSLLKVKDAAEEYRTEFELFGNGNTVRLIETRLELFAALDEWHKVEKEGLF